MIGVSTTRDFLFFFLSFYLFVVVVNQGFSVSLTVINGKYLMGLCAGENEHILRRVAKGVYHFGR
jgi:hypothetical protein